MPSPGGQLRYYDFAMAAFAVILICSNMIGAAKPAQVELPVWGTVTFGAGILFFPLSYVLGDVLTEVYGYARARRVVWVGFAASLFAATMSFVHRHPAARSHYGRPGRAGRSVRPGAAHLPRLHPRLLGRRDGQCLRAGPHEALTGGKMLWTRTIGSTVVGQGVDTLIFYPLAFWGIWEPSLVFSVMATNYALKVLWEAAADAGHLQGRRLVQGKPKGWTCSTRKTDFTPFKTRV
jgi:queuosine precursor transporter